MRQGPNTRRSRGRGGNGTSRRSNVPNRNQTFDSNGPDVRIRGNAHQIFEKYQALARDSQGAGDRVMAENYLQHAEHYQRIINTFNDSQQSHQQAHQHAQQQSSTAQAAGSGNGSGSYHYHSAESGDEGGEHAPGSSGQAQRQSARSRDDGRGRGDRGRRQGSDRQTAERGSGSHGTSGTSHGSGQSGANRVNGDQTGFEDLADTSAPHRGSAEGDTHHVNSAEVELFEDPRDSSEDVGDGNFAEDFSGGNQPDSPPLETAKQPQPVSERPDHSGEEATAGASDDNADEVKRPTTRKRTTKSRSTRATSARSKSASANDDQDSGKAVKSVAGDGDAGTETTDSEGPKAADSSEAAEETPKPRTRKRSTTGTTRTRRSTKSKAAESESDASSEVGDLGL